jgi:pyruvate/2-oxoglutarate/acetoin dehydrogenase E1 component/TPP-dependent pyruvate/acetoin dehydrogenase alpha subunit
LNDGAPQSEKATFQFTRESILRDYRIAYQSREVSLLARKEVLTGKAKFGIFGDGKEVAQVALARACRPGDFRAGYYRDQTLLFALGLLSIEEFFAQVYADPSVEREPASGGRQMNAHFATRMLDEAGEWRNQVETFNSSADLSPTGSQMPRLVGLAWASRLYRELAGKVPGAESFSHGGDEIAFGTIGDASCAEGLFWESVNAAGVLGVPVLLSVWDDGYGISVPVEQQITKASVSDLLQGFQRAPGGSRGYDIYAAKGWDYPGLCETYLSASEVVRREHVPALIHVRELTQPQGHSTSGSQERYKDAARLAWEREHDCLKRMREWMEAQGIASAKELDEAEAEDRDLVRLRQQRAWERFRQPIEAERRAVVALVERAGRESARGEALDRLRSRLEGRPNALRRDLLALAGEALVALNGEGGEAAAELRVWRSDQLAINRKRYGSHLYSEGARSALEVSGVAPEYLAEAPRVNGSEILNACFDAALTRHPELVAFGEDVGRLGDVNQGMAGLQARHGVCRVSDTGIREATILGQAIGLALRGLRPIAEIQYLDYLLYALQILSDDLATLRWRTRGGQKAPVIVRTRGHRLEGVWHSGSPMAAIIHLIRGVWVCVPRDMTRAAGFYNTLLRSDDPGLVVEVLNGYRTKEPLPENLDRLTVPLGVPEILRPGGDLTLVTYGACCRLALEAAEALAAVEVEVEVIDVQTLLPFDRPGVILDSLRRTNRVLFLDEDVPGGATAYMLQQVLVEQGGYEWLDEAPATHSAQPHRPAYGSDGDYFSKPNRESIFEAAYELVRRSDPRRYPNLFG